MPKEAKKRYANKCMVRTVTFYLKDKDIYDFSKTINFQEFVKTCLKCELMEKRAKESKDVVISLNEEDYLK